jgi:hypothetical protein
MANVFRPNCSKRPPRDSLALTDDEHGWTVKQHRTRYRAITWSQLERAAVQDNCEQLNLPEDVVVEGRQVATVRRPLRHPG